MLIVINIKYWFYVKTKISFLTFETPSNRMDEIAFNIH